ncbi:MAG TPA: UDP-N-acetylmuramate--L-alanine ligase [Thermoanaerobaculia bacterium]|nr:UDP-N-acetylmuramate--L-alanine ligase [Thermoanaerobaculia bacterium]
MSFAQFADLSRIHFVGIGGAGMSGIAEILLEYDLAVSGSDQAASEVTERLATLGAEIRLGHAPGNVEGADVVVISSAIPDENPEIAEARRRGIPVVRRAEMLAELMRLKYGIAIAGTHGKTTTTSLVGHVLTEAGLDPTVIVGGRVRVLGTGARLGHSQYLVAEADEYDRSFLTLAPIVAVLTTIDRDHLDTYGTMEAILDAFVTFANRVPFFGRAWVCLDDPNVQAILPRLAERRLSTYGLARQADLAAVDVEPVPGTPAGTRFGVRSRDRGLLGTIELPMPGRHNVQNALAAVGVGLTLRLEFAAIAAALATFPGVHRRFEQLGAWRGAAVVDDYAHHPTEVAATLGAARQSFPRARIHAIFQPHLYSRTVDQAEAFGRSLLGADRVLVTDVYASREQPVAGVSGEMVVQEARRSGHRNVVYCPSWRSAPDLLAAEVAAGDVVLTLGAGDVYKLARELVADAPAGEPALGPLVREGAR